MTIDLTLEKEFNRVKFETMKRVVNAVTMKEYVASKLKGNTIPTYLVDKEELAYKASEVADNVMRKILEEDMLEQAFNESWEIIKEYLP